MPLLPLDCNRAARTASRAASTAASDSPMFSGYEPEVVNTQAFSFPRAIGILVAGVFVFALMIFVLVKANRTPKTTSYTPPPRPFMSPTESPTPYVLTFGGEGTGPGLFQDAQDVAVDGDGNIYVSDDTLRVQKFNSQGEFLNLWTIPSSTGYYSKIRGGPDRLLVDRQGRVYVVIGGVVLKYEGAKAGWLVVKYDMNPIYDAALKADGGMVVVSGSSESDDLAVYDAQGKATKLVHQFISAQLDKRIPVEALKVAVDGVGNIFAIYALGSVYGEHYYDNSDLAVFRFTPDGKYVNRFGGGGNEPGQFDSPNAIAVDSHSRVYVCDLTRGISVFTDDGRYLETLKTPYWVQGMAFGPAGDLFVVGDNHVSKLVLSK